MIRVMECPFCGKFFRPRETWGSCEFNQWLANIGQKIPENFNRITGKWKCPNCGKQWMDSEGLPMRWIKEGEIDD